MPFWIPNMVLHWLSKLGFCLNFILVHSKVLAKYEFDHRIVISWPISKPWSKFETILCPLNLILFKKRNERERLHGPDRFMSQSWVLLDWISSDLSSYVYLQRAHYVLDLYSLQDVFSYFVSSILFVYQNHYVLGCRMYLAVKCTESFFQFIFAIVSNGFIGQDIVVMLCKEMFSCW